MTKKLRKDRKGKLPRTKAGVPIYKLARKKALERKFSQEQPTPKPGDIVIAIKTDDTLIPVGTKGVIEGIEGQRRRQYSVLFNWSPLPWWDRGFIDSSGGPSRILRASKLTYKGRVKQDFKYFPHLPGADLAEVKTHRVSCWEVDLTKS